MDEEQFGLRLGAANYLRKPVDPQRLEEAFQHIEAHLSVAVRQLLVVEDNQIERNSIIQLLECERDVVCTGAASGKEALEQLRSSQFDAFILDLHLPDMSGYEVLQAVAADQSIRRTPAIVYTGKDLTIEEEKQLRQYAESIVLKTAESPARLLEEAIIFITATHRSAPASQQDQAVPDPLPAAAGARQKQPADGNAQSAAAAQW
jgi:CheY-like chemotaxis protein